MNSLERKLSYEDIRFYRSIAKSQLRKEKALIGEYNIVKMLELYTKFSNLIKIIFFSQKTKRKRIKTITTWLVKWVVGWITIWCKNLFYFILTILWFFLVIYYIELPLGGRRRFNIDWWATTRIISSNWLWWINCGANRRGSP